MLKSSKSIAALVALLCFASACQDEGGGSAAEQSGSTKASSSGTTIPSVDLGVVEVGPLPEDFEVGVATSRWVIGTTQGRRVLEVRDAEAEKVLHTYRSPMGYDVEQEFIDEPYLVIVLTSQSGSKKDRLVVLDLENFSSRELGKGAPPPAQGSYDVGSGKVAYASRDGSKYCVALARLDTLRGSLGECVGPRHGIHQIRTTPYGVSYTTFDDRLPSSCGTARVKKPRTAPETVEPERKCEPWEALALAKDTVMWSEIPKPSMIEFADFYARVGGGEARRIGEGTTGSLVWCGESAWYVSQKESRLMRWTPDDGIQIAYQAPQESGESASLVGAPSCSSGSLSFPVVPNVDNGKEYVVRANVLN